MRSFFTGASRQSQPFAVSGILLILLAVSLASSARAQLDPRDGDTASRSATDIGQPSAAQGELGIDLGKVRELRVAEQTTEDAPVRVGNLDVLAPIMPLLPKLGASLTTVDVANIPGNPNTPTEDHIFQINLQQGSPIVLTAGNTVARIGPNEQQLRAAPLLIRGKMWLPVFSLAPLLGASVRLDDNGVLHMNPTVQSVELFPVKGVLALTVKTSCPVPSGTIFMGTLEDPPKLYIDFRGFSMGLDAANSTRERTVSEGMGDIRKVRVGMFQNFPDTTRVVLDLAKELNPRVLPVPDNTLYALVFGGAALGRPSMLPGDERDILRGLKIVVDAGHGGHDSGAPGAHCLEKNITLDMARRLRDKLTARGATVMMTRDDDYYVTLQGRVDYANSRNADIFFSVHINSYTSPASNGTATYYFTAPSSVLARCVQDELVKATGLKSRGVQQARYWVIKYTTMPAILTESAFITNAHEEALMMDPDWRDRVTNGMALGVVSYVRTYLRPSATSG